MSDFAYADEFLARYRKIYSDRSDDARERMDCLGEVHPFYSGLSVDEFGLYYCHWIAEKEFSSNLFSVFPSEEERGERRKFILSGMFSFGFSPESIKKLFLSASPYALSFQGIEEDIISKEISDIVVSMMLDALPKNVSFEEFIHHDGTCHYVSSYSIESEKHFCILDFISSKGGFTVQSDYIAKPDVSLKDFFLVSAEESGWDFESGTNESFNLAMDKLVASSISGNREKFGPYHLAFTYFLSADSFPMPGEPPILQKKSYRLKARNGSKVEVSEMELYDSKILLHLMRKGFSESEAGNLILLSSPYCCLHPEDTHYLERIHDSVSNNREYKKLAGFKSKKINKRLSMA